MKYLCKTCNYETDRQFCYKKHLATTKHSKKVAEDVKATSNAPRELITVSPNIFKCPYCNIIYTRANNLTRHKKICSDNFGENGIKKIQELESKNNELMKELQFQQQLQQQQQKQQQELQKQQQDEINHLKTLINNAGAVIKTSVSALSYVTQNYGDAPVLKKLKDYSYLQEIDIDSDDDEFDLSQLIINQHTDKTIVKYLGNIIVDAYKTEDPSKRSIWNSDSVRLTYMIRELINKKPDWTVDKKGVKTTKYVIEPLLEYIRQLMADFIENNRLENFLHDSDWRMKRRMDNLKAAGEICLNIKNKSLEEQILKYIAPHFYLVKNEQLIDG